MDSIVRIGLLTSLMMGCSSANTLFKKDKETSAAASEQVAVNAEVGKEALMLAAVPMNADDFRIEINGCRSGHATVLTKADPDASLVVGDKDCVGKLVSFTIDGVVYTPTSAGFNTYAAGGSAIFQNADATKLLKVSVIQQIASDLDKNLIDEDDCQRVTYAFSGITKSPGKVITPDAVGALGKVVGYAPPAFTMDLALLLDVNDDGSGLFWFDLACNAAHLNAEQMATCKAQIPDVRYLLVEDTFAGTLTQAQADDLFATLASSAPGTAYANHFETVNLSGPAQMMQHRQMLFVVKYGDSYQYFEVDLDDLPDVNCDGCEPEETPVQLDECETAFALGETTFVSLGLGSNRWGWQFDVDLGGGSAPISGSKELWAGAGQNNLANGTLVGRVDYSFDGSLLNLTYVMKPGAQLKATHLYADTSNVTTTAPGQFGHQQGETDPQLGTYALSFAPAIASLNVVAHAEVCPAP